MLARIRSVTPHRMSADAEEGTSTLEYGLLVAAVAALIMTVVFALGSFVKNNLGTSCDDLRSKANSTTVTAGVDCTK